MHFLAEDFAGDPVSSARMLVGSTFHWKGCRGRIVETEAYAATGDEACHTFSRPSARRFVERQQSGDAYVYFNYGMYWLLNVLVKAETEDRSGFVLIRAAEPLRGIAAMRRRRGRTDPASLCSGPGKLTIAFGIDRSVHGLPVAHCFERVADPVAVIASPRIGISRARRRPWRFCLRDSPFVSARPR